MLRMLKLVDEFYLVLHTVLQPILLGLHVDVVFPGRKHEYDNRTGESCSPNK